MFVHLIPQANDSICTRRMTDDLIEDMHGRGEQWRRSEKSVSDRLRRHECTSKRIVAIDLSEAEVESSRQRETVIATKITPFMSMAR